MKDLAYYKDCVERICTDAATIADSDATSWMLTTHVELQNATLDELLEESKELASNYYSIAGKLASVAGSLTKLKNHGGTMVE